MLKNTTRFVTLLGAIACLLTAPARAAVKDLVDADKITWSGAEVFYLHADNSFGTATDYDHLVLKFTNNTEAAGTLTFAAGVKGQARILAVGGGGAGGSGGTGNSKNYGAGGGGGAGGFLALSAVELSSGAYNVTVGSGGLPSAAGSNTIGGDGSSSIIKLGQNTLWEAYGGGGGGACCAGASTGGSGGGGSQAYGSKASPQAGGTCTSNPPQGSAGGAGNTGSTAGGGGGASKAGDNGGTLNVGAAGGDGAASDILPDADGNAVYYAGGGGSGVRLQTALNKLGAGGQGGGGRGAGTSGDADVPAEAGDPGTGGGGGGGTMDKAGGAGGSGVVIIRVLDAAELQIPVPEIAPLTWNGEEQSAFEFNYKYEYFEAASEAERTTNATAVGTYYFWVRPRGDFEWMNEGGKNPKKIEWQIVKRQIAVPEVREGLVYNGSLQDGFETTDGFDNYGSYDIDSVDIAINAGNYSATAILDDPDNTEWLDGTTAPKPLYWSIQPQDVTKPKLPGGLVYTGTNNVAFVAGEGYECVAGGVTNAVNAGIYDFTVKLANPEHATNYVWAGESAYPAKTAPLSMSWQIASIRVRKPEPCTNLVYNAELQNAFVGPLPEMCIFSEGEQWCTNAVEGGTYQFSFEFPANVGDDGMVHYRNYVWADYENPDNDNPNPYQGTWTIAAATNILSEIHLAGWRIGTEATAPEFTATWGQEKAEITYGKGETLESVVTWTKYPNTISEAGTWWVQVVIPETSSWTLASNATSFVMWNNPEEIYHHQVEITVAPHAGTATLTDFPIAVTLSEAALFGFSYAEAAPDKATAEKRFIFMSEFGDLLPYEVERWDPTGESVVWVKLAQYPPAGLKLTLFWDLRDGQQPPDNDPLAVWASGDYLGVWHMDEASGEVADASGNNHPARPYRADTGSAAGTEAMVAAPGVFGNARVNATVYEPNGNRLLTDHFNCGDCFTFSGWFWMEKEGLSAALAGNLAKNGSQGWCVETLNNSKTRLTVRVGDQAYQSTTDFGTMPGNWNYFSLIFTNLSASAGTAWLYSYPIHAQDANKGMKQLSTISVQDNDAFQFAIGAAGLKDSVTTGGNSSKKFYSFSGRYDEVRLRRGAVAPDVLAAECAAGQPGFLTSALVKRDGKFLNYWKRLPTLTKDSWQALGEAPGEIADWGELAVGTVSNYIYSVYAPETHYTELSQLTAAGLYKIVFLPAESAAYPASDYEPLEYTLTVRLLSSKPFNDIGGLTGNSGRILLMNNHIGQPGVPDVDYQGWYDSDNFPGSALTPTVTYWHFNNFAAIDSYRLVAGTESMLMAIDGRKLWHLVDCRHGNIYPKYLTDPLSTDLNYLPWDAAYSRAISSHGKKGQTVANRATAGQLVMRNSKQAAIYSSCFTNGIGTIYFDAVNGWAQVGGEKSKIAVEIATSTTDGDRYPPTDFNCLYAVGVETNLYGKARWRRVEMIAYKRDGTPTFDAGTRCMELPLDITHGGTMDNFYRVVVPVNYSGAVRFRIIRTGIDKDYNPDDRALILLDNIIASVPPMGAKVIPRGTMDPEKGGKQLLGWEGSAQTLTPQVGETLTGYGRPALEISSGVKIEGFETMTNDFFASATMHYRWRYLNQGVGDWQSVEMRPLDDFATVSPLVLPSQPGDVEYWFEYSLQAPYYQYVDYSGKALTLPYSEERGTETNRLDVANQASGGRDWFFRLREAESAYSSVDLILSRNGAEPERIPLDLSATHVWRGVAQTREEHVGPVTYRFELKTDALAPDGSLRVTTNRWYCALENATFPVSDKLEEGTTNDWSALTFDAATGHVMFMIDESTKALTVVHADYQDFNNWSDAQGPIFVGTSVTNAYKTGVSVNQQLFTETFDTWRDLPAESDDWLVPAKSYTDIHHLYRHKAYEAFPSDTNGLWSVGPGMWISQKYRHDLQGSGVALQMEGCGKGFLEFTDVASAPRGLESITFNARLGQFIDFADFSYYWGSVIMDMSNYTLMTRVAFDQENNQGFSGNASISLVANYLPGKGGYEARWEYIGRQIAQADDPTKVLPGLKGQRLALYRWKVGSDSRTTCEEICAWTNTVFDLKGATSLDSSPACFYSFFISVSNDVQNSATFVIAGINKTPCNLAQQVTQLPRTGWYGVTFRDASPERLKTGTYGALTANCPGVIAHPQTLSHALDPVGSDRGGFSDAEIPFPAFSPSEWRDCYTDFSDRENVRWYVTPGRMTTTNETISINGLLASPIEQDLKLYLGAAGRTNFTEPITNVHLMGFGTATGVTTLPLYTTADCSIKFAVGGAFGDPRADVVIDSVSMRQWRGADWNTDGPVSGASEYLPPWAWPGARDNVYGFSNFVFQTCWIKDKSLLMSAKRTAPGGVCAIRSPLMDGYKRDGRGGDGSSRGSGLGVFSFSYANAQSNVVLQLQVATNGVDYGSIIGLDHSLDPANWTTITNFDFSVMSDLQRESGELSCYVGIHGLSSAMRLLLATNVVEAVRGETDPNLFGDILITEVACRDEPAIDGHCWWGWNLRTVGDELDSEQRMYLPDYRLIGEPRSGLSVALNNSVDKEKGDINVKEYDSYLRHKPFVQTPTFTSNIVGEVSFKARKYSASDHAAQVTLFGSKDLTDSYEGTWKRLAWWPVEDTLYQTYTYKTDPGDSYKAFRLAVTGVPGVHEDISGGGNMAPEGFLEPVRVLMDDMLVSEAVRARMAFRNIGCFRHDMAGTAEVPNVPSKEEQPLWQEAWGVQTEIYGAQLADDIDFDRKPRVRLYWFKGTFPWGFDNWKDLIAEKAKTREAGTAWLTQTTDSHDGHYVYRSSQRTCPEAVIPMAVNAPEFVQYMLEVIYYVKGAGSVATTNRMTAADWQTPAWYRPVDLNAEYGHNNPNNFAAFNILDSVAPGWAWINEVNLYGGEDQYERNLNADLQYVEIAAPVEADLSDWYVQLLLPMEGEGVVVTNTLGIFGAGDLKPRKDAKYLSVADNNSRMAFRVLANRQARTNGHLKYEDGTLDGVWDFENPTMELSRSENGDTEISDYNAVAFQLVRSSGVIEHEIVTLGFDWWAEFGDEWYAANHSPTNIVNLLNEYLRAGKANFFYAGDDDNRADLLHSSRGVFKAKGREPGDWNNTMTQTPGHLNMGQYIDPDHPMPSGEDILIYAQVSGDHIQQLSGEIFTNDLVMLSVQKGSARGTNLTYRVDPWYVVGAVSTNQLSAMGSLERHGTTQPALYTLHDVGKGASNNVTVIASAAPDPRLAEEFGVGPDNAYRSAIIKWLEEGRDLWGNKWDADKIAAGELKLADFCDMSGNVITNLSLTEMYWLDLDPTAGDLALRGGVSDPAHEVEGGQYVRMGVYLMVTNRAEGAEPACWPPYALRGRDPGSSSIDFVPGDLRLNSWRSETFKITGRLLNSYTTLGSTWSKVPLRWFVFTPDSFNPDGTAVVDILNPQDPNSIGYTSWGSWWRKQQEAGETPTAVGYDWMIDTRLQPIGIEVLQKESTYEDEDDD